MADLMIFDEIVGSAVDGDILEGPSSGSTKINTTILV
jgi:hypothetical protein